MKALFGRPARVLLTSWILEERRAFFQAEAQDALRAFGQSPSAVAQELEKLTTFGLLSRIEPGAGERRVWFQPLLQHPLWEAFKAITAAVEQASSESAATNEGGM